MNVSKPMVGFAILAVTGIFLWFFIDLMRAVDGYRGTGAYEPNAAELAVIPATAGALAVLLALAVGAPPTFTFWSGSADKPDKFKKLLKELLTIKVLLLGAALAYAIACVVGLIVWNKNATASPELLQATAMAGLATLIAGVIALGRG
jgi:hypothetical protein